MSEPVTMKRTVEIAIPYVTVEEGEFIQIYFGDHQIEIHVTEWGEFELNCSQGCPPFKEWPD